MIRVVRTCVIIGVILTASTIITIIITSYLLGPPPLLDEAHTVLYDENGNEIVTTTATVDYVQLTDISPHFLEAIVLVEDSDFYEHYGFDFLGIVRAIGKNIQAKRLKEGASTITQQYARNAYLSHEKTWIRKLKEAFYTIRLEMFYDKETILTGYVNSIYFGHGAYGIKRASEVYFKKQPKQLTLAEATMLAGVPKGPTYYSPFHDEEKAKTRQRFILELLLRAEKITQADFHHATTEKLEFDTPYKEEAETTRFFIDLVEKEAANILQEDVDRLWASGLTIETTLNKQIQHQLEEEVKKRVPENRELEMGAIIIDPTSGAVKSLIGGTSYEKSTFNRATQAKRMVGSTFKPFVYYAALEKGFTPTTRLLSEPTRFVASDGTIYEPKNYNDYYAYKPISLAQAMALSDNIYAVKTNLYLEPKTVAMTAKKFGITSTLPEVPSLALGSASVSLAEMTTAYGMIANGGKEIHFYTIEKIRDRTGRVIFERNVVPKQVLDEKKTFLLTHLMQGMFDRRLNGHMEVTGSTLINELRFNYAGKSGTTDTDSWMIGFSPKFAIGVWVGYDDNRRIKNPLEKQLAKKIWAAMMEFVHQEETDVSFPIPTGVVKRTIDVDTGLLATEHCEVTRETYFERGTEPKTYCTHHRIIAEQENDDKKTNPFQWLVDFFIKQ